LRRGLGRDAAPASELNNGRIRTYIFPLAEGGLRGVK